MTNVTNLMMKHGDYLKVRRSNAFMVMHTYDSTIKYIYIVIMKHNNYFIMRHSDKFIMISL